MATALRIHVVARSMLLVALLMCGSHPVDIESEGIIAIPPMISHLVEPV